MKRTFITICLLIVVLGVSSQRVKAPASKMKFDIGPQFSYAINTSFNKTHSMGLGATTRAAYYFTPEISTGIRVNYDYFLGRKYTVNNVNDRYFNLTWTSFLANFQYDFDKNIFIGGDGGLGILSIKGDATSMFNSSLYIGKAVKFSKSSMGISFFWTQAREAGSRDETIGLRAHYRFN
ncbi:MAG TPA: hypothetical protein VFN30_09835 [Chitinophagaceae bacterium]|nr:hypothetical protein [Chitinophagaceae bacterium]